MNYEVFDLSLYWTALLYLSLLLASLYLVNSSKSSPMNRQQQQQPQPQPPQPRPPRKEKQPAKPPADPGTLVGAPRAVMRAAATPAARFA